MATWPDFACRACGRPPWHATPGTWGGLQPLELLTGARWFDGESGVFLCPPCRESIGLELSELPAFQRARGPQ